MSQVISPYLFNIPTSQKAAASGIASLDANTLVPVVQIPALSYGKISSGTYVGTGVSQTINHTLGCIPKFLIVNTTLGEPSFSISTNGDFLIDNNGSSTLTNAWTNTTFNIPATAFNTEACNYNWVAFV